MGLIIQQAYRFQPPGSANADVTGFAPVPSNPQDLFISSTANNGPQIDRSMTKPDGTGGPTLTPSQLMAANTIIQKDEGLRGLLGLGTGSISNADIMARLDALPPERKQLATSMLSYNIAALETADQRAQAPFSTFATAAGPELENLPRDVKKLIGAERRPNAKGKLTAAEAKTLLARHPKLFNETVSAMAQSKDPAMQTAAREMIDQNLSLPQNDRNKLLEHTGVSPNQLAAVNRDYNNALQGEIQSRAKGVYKTLGGQTELASSQFIATGDGTGTHALPNPKDRPNLGVGMFRYDLDSTTGKPGGRQEVTIRPQTGSNSTSLMLDLDGIDHSGGKVNVSVGGKTLELSASSKDKVLRVSKDEDFDKSQHPMNDKVSVYKSGELEIHHDTEKHIFTVMDPSRRDISVSMASQSSKGDLDELTLGVYAAPTPKVEAKPVSVEVPLTDAYELGSWKLNEAKVNQQLEQGLSADQKRTLAEHFEAGGGLLLRAEGHGIGHLDQSGKVVDGASASQTGPNQALRFTKVEAELMRTDSGNFLKVDVGSFTDDVNAQGIRNKLTPAGKAYFDDLLAKNPGLDPNDVLSGLRSFSMVDHLQGVLQRDYGLAPDKARAALEMSSVKLDGMSISYSDFKMMTGR